MTDRYDAVTSRKDKNGKTRYTKIGAAFPSKQGEGFNIVLDALPMPNAEGQAWIALFVPKLKDGATASAPAAAEEMNDDIPY